jgi:excisionase family DNA binding protein
MGVTGTAHPRAVPNGDLEAALMTVAEVAAFLKVHRRTVLDLIAAGDLRAVNVGGLRTHGARWRVGRGELARFVESRVSSIG